MNQSRCRDAVDPARSNLIRFFAFTCLYLCCLCPGCKDDKPTGTAKNLQADYDRIKAEFEEYKRSAEAEKRNLVSDKESKIAELVMDNANLRQRLLVVEPALSEAPLVQDAEHRNAVWVHVVYCIAIVACLVPLFVLLWLHVTLRERVRLYVARTSRVVPPQEVSYVSAESK